WHNGLTNGVANAMYNRQDSVLVILDNFYTSATGQHHNPSTGTNARKEPTGMTIPQALRGVGVSWIRTVDSYDIPKMIGTLHRARGVPAGTPAAAPAAPAYARGGGRDGGAAALRRGPGRLHRRPLVHAPQRVSVADAAREPRSAPRGSDRARGRHVRRLRRVRRGRARGGAVPVLLRGAGDREPRPVDAAGRQAAPRRHRRPRASVTDSGLVSLLIPAVGGQGGGVLSEWIVEAAALDSYRAHGTSIPGVAQRTGSTTYYVELVTDRD